MRFSPTIRAALVLTMGMGFAGSSPRTEGANATSIFPAARWESISPEAAGMRSNKLAEFAALVGGRGCVARGGRMTFAWGEQEKSSDIASAFKPVLTTLLFIAVQEGRISGVDEAVARFEPRLRTLNGGKDAEVTWRHLASQTSGYGLAEKPGAAYSYNDFAITLYFDTLMDKVFQTNATEVLRTRLAEPLGFEDSHTFNAFGPKNRPGRLALSCRDFARIGLLYARGGRWNGRQVLREEFARLAVSSPLPVTLPLTRGAEAEMLPGQRSMGGGKNITPAGPGFYSFNWWLNGTNADGQRLFVDAPTDAWIASGHGGKRVMAVVPSLNLVVCWNDSRIDDHDKSPGHAETKNNRAWKLLAEACATSP